MFNNFLSVLPVHVPEANVEEPARVLEPIVEEPQPAHVFGQQRHTLRYLYESLIPPTRRPANHLQIFRPTVGQFADARELGDINNPQGMDVDAACFFMLSHDLPLLLGAIIRPGNRKVKIRDVEGFGDWLHVVSDPVVVRVYAGETDFERELTKAKILEVLKISFGISLTTNENSLILSRNQVNVSTIAMAEALYISGARICRVGFFGMKMPIGIAEPLIDNLVGRYLESLTPELEAGILHNKSVFDIGIVTPTESVELFSFSDDQKRAKKYREGKVHEMCNHSNFGSLSFRPMALGGIKQIKIYQKLVHVILSVIARDNLDDMPKTMLTIRTRARQLQALLRRLELMTRDDEIKGTRMEVTVRHVDTVQAARRLCSESDILRIQGIENMLEGRFDKILIQVPNLIQDFKVRMENLRAATRGTADALVPPIRARVALTLARHTIGWSGKGLQRQLREAKAWEERDRQIRSRREDVNHVYDGCELDPEETRIKVVEFLSRAMWCHHPRLRDKSGEPLLLRKGDGRGFWPKQNVYDDRVGAARFFLEKFGANWKTHVMCRPETSSSESSESSSGSSSS